MVCCVHLGDGQGAFRTRREQLLFPLLKKESRLK